MRLRRRPPSFAEETAALLPDPFVLPDALRQLLDWCEGNGFVRGTAGHRLAALHGSDRDEVGSHLLFAVEPAEERGEHAAAWLGNGDPAVTARLVPVARLGADGTHAAFWLDDTGRQRIVALGSGSGSTLSCVLADDPVDLLRLLAVGYQELAWPEEWSEPPQVDPDDAWRPDNAPFRAWVTTTFGVSIPTTASELVPDPARMDDDDPVDDFARWVLAVQG